MLLPGPSPEGLCTMLAPSAGAQVPGSSREDMDDLSFDTDAGGATRRQRWLLRAVRIAAGSVLIVAPFANAQMPSAPILQNVWATHGLVGAVNVGGGSDATVYAAAVSFAASRLQFSGGLGYQTRTGMSSRTVYGIRAAMPLGGVNSAVGFGAFAGIGGGPTSRTAADSAASTTEVPLGVSVGWRKAFRGARGASLYASPAYVLFSGGSKSGGLFRVGAGADVGITNALGATLGAELGGTRARGIGGPSGVLYGVGVSYAFGKR